MNLSRSTFLFPCALLALAGCGTDEGTSNPNDVTGTIVDLYVTDTGDVAKARDATTTSITALVQGSDGQFLTIKGTIATDGSFVIPGVPQGNYYLQIDTEQNLILGWIVTSERTLDLGIVYMGRPDAVILKNETTLALQLDGLVAWQESDSMELFSTGAGTVCNLPSGTTGETTLTAPVDMLESCTDSLGSQSPPAIDASKGDKTFVTQLASYGDPAGGERYISVRKVLEPQSFSVADGQTAPLSGAVADVPQKTFQVAWDQAGWNAAAAEVHPQATVDFFSLSMSVEPGGARSTAALNPTLLTYDSADPAAKLLTDFQYGNPYPSEWPEYHGASVSYSIMLTAPGSMTPRRATATMTYGGAGAPAAGTTFAPALTPPREIKINGQAATADLTGVGTNPTVSWTAPSKGSAVSYTVTVRKLDPMGGPTRTISNVRTRETSVILPPGMLENGSHYFLRVRATDRTADLQAPYQYPGPSAGVSSAEALTSMISP